MRFFLFLGLFAVLPSVAAQAQDTPVPPTQQPIPDTTWVVRHSPLNYMVRSFLLPGWGQAALDRKLSGAIFIAFEGISIGMALKANAELGHLERIESERLEDKRSERQDWFVLMGINHLFSGLEAFVSANLFDFPGDLTIRALPNGKTGYGLRFPMPRQ